MCLVAGVVLPTAASGVDPFPGDWTGVSIAADLPADIEPSGIVWHPRLECLLVVDDSGWLVAVDRDGDNIRYWWVGGDLEAICITDPASDFVYLGCEYPNSILEFNLATGAVTRAFDLTPYLVNPPNYGLEAMTFVPLWGHSEGGLFYVGHQLDGRLYVFHLPILTSTDDTDVIQVASFPLAEGRWDLSGMCYDPHANVIYAVWDSADIIAAVTLNGTIIHEWTVPGGEQEGIAVIGCRIFIADDLGDVRRHAFWAIEVDSDNDGVSDCFDECPGTPEGVEVKGNGCPTISCPQIPRYRPADDRGGEGRE